jgi:prefoldin subunit 5
MLRYLFSLLVLCGAAAVAISGQSSGSSQSQGQSQGQSQAQAQPAAGSSSATSTAKSSDAKTAPDPAKKKPKKVWTDDDISKVGGTISVVGDSSAPQTDHNSAPANSANTPTNEQDAQIKYYRDQLQPLQAQLDATEKKIEDLRSFKADNSSASGGINPNKGYTMTPVADQIKQLEDQKKQIQDKIDVVIDEARKKGISSGQLR